MAIKHIHPVTLGISLSLLVGTAIPGIATSYARSENKPYWRELGAFLLHNVAPGELVVHDITAWRAPYYSPGVRKAIVESSAGDLDAFYARNSVVWLTLRTRDKNLALREWVEAKPHWALDFGSGVYVAYVQQGSTTPELWRKLLTMSLGPKAAPYVSLGRQFAFLQNTQQAEAYFKTALLKEGSLVDAYTCLGQLYEAEGRVAEAIAEYEKATHAILKDPESYFHLGVAYRTLGKTEQAASCFRQALQLAGDYDYYKYYNALAETYLTMGQPEAAARLYEKALKRHSWLNQQWYFHLNLGKAYQKAGQRQKAWESFKKAWMLRPDSEETGKALEDLVTTGGTSFGSSIPDLRATINAQPSAIQYRVGVAVNASDAFPKITGEEIKKLGAGWYCDWHTDLRYPLPDLEYVPIIPVLANHYPPSGPQLIYLEMLLNHRPGALWLIGSEPENAQGANLAPAEYAEIYHNYYQFIKERDPWAQVSTGGIAQPTLLRLRWLEEVIAAYQSHYNQPLPVDAWNIHILILREKKPYPDCPDCWGIGVPAGLEGVAQGQLYEIQDNADPNIFRQLVIEFRKWMKRNGFQDKPLIISQFGVLMPSDMLGESLEAGDMVVQTFLQETLDFLFTAQDEELGCPTDGGRLVQRWLWYSLNDRLPYVKETTGELRGANGSLVYWDTPDRLTPFGETFRAYMDKLLMSSP